MSSERVKSHRRWAKELLKWFYEHGIERCESCGSDFGVAPAHALKRRFILTREEYFRAVLLCTKCHHFVEYGDWDNPGTHARMERMIDALIESR